jgi:proteasome lid subunit RPN8/RPN11
MSLILTAEQATQIESEGVAAYPNECCGAMLGKDTTEGSHVRRTVHRLEKLTNSFTTDEQYHRFSLDPRELMQLDKRAGEAGLAVLGFYHSHPDHPARPSETDRQNAWPFYSYVIVAIEKRQAVDLTSWQLDESSEQFKPEQIIQEQRKGNRA